ncbi:MAG: hypothetical protein ACE5FL_08625 [Myxococcota bacterium]
MRDRPRIGELLVEAGVIGESQLAAALGEQRQWGRPLGMTLVRMGFLDEESLVRTLANQLKLPIVKLAGKRVNQEVLDLVPIDLAEKHRCIPLLRNDEGGQKVLYLGMEDPADQEAIAELSFRVGHPVKPVLVAPRELDEALHRHYHWASYGDPTPLAADPTASDPNFNPSFGEPVGQAGAGASTPLAAGPEDSAGGAVPPAAILRALVQLLVEKGVVSRDELVERVGQVVTQDGDDF